MCLLSVHAPDIVVLVSGDSDFIPIVLDMRNRGIRVEVSAFEAALSRHLSSGFINLDAIIDTSNNSTEDFKTPTE